MRLTKFIKNRLAYKDKKYVNFLHHFTTSRIDSSMLNINQHEKAESEALIKVNQAAEYKF
ncbi:hypothetical protein LPB140_01475 [Sphingorhabdus lutea]|uniref:Uncharacterized protein n=1 Tax=Sphingorhabdus lutea TaxID=1913578 RepID=A0A1L3J9B5_9SPHN|nr:hypothetical protein LPB140_01475 [Sphingorhabdus lutea]